MNVQHRLNALRQRLPTLEVEALVLLNVEGSDAANLRYLTGFVGSAAALVLGAECALFLTDSRYLERAKGELQGPQVRQIKRILDVAQVLNELGYSRVGINADRVSVRLFEQIQAALEGPELVPLEDPVARLRWRKDPEEIERISRAQELTDEAFAFILKKLEPGLSEAEVAWQLEVFLRENGSDGLAFPLMVASGPHSALPHHATGERVLRAGEFVLFDFGAKCNGYCADMTRTVFLGKPEEQHRQVYELVRRAQGAALEALRAGTLGKAADAAAREVIEAGGYGENFGHGLGHGVGLEVHEGPRLSPLFEDGLPEGAVVTVEPGVYLPGWGGVRVEDLVVVRSGGIENLTRSPKELICL